MTITYHHGSIAELLAVDAAIPEFERHNTEQVLSSRLTGKKTLILIARDNNQPIAYKLGYPLNAQAFYSWLGGVVPAYRKQGIASALREQQEQWALTEGYQQISVKSMNRYPAMLRLLIASGYQIVGYENNGNSNNSKICFSKSLKQS
ncbi:GNAT family N-acetyltransferase [Agarivorans sp. TSD2052]|uniref:GNAT family N-acetyltransferase n=1 Tax=Agarivorans sp. TSD2052 TaxID=2937286 RepID=UPI00200D10F7|nr:GNAT family N-acetyltransferase [Agarivorans sp. TSD2052]UPW18167.1 GNAT family N-acetyltransferase [Agarivorans sp. TSD2052]